MYTQSKTTFNIHKICDTKNILHTISHNNFFFVFVIHFHKEQGRYYIFHRRKTTYKENPLYA